jgi:type I restriction enzyme S subunit
MSQLPPNWLRAPIGSLCDLKNGRAFKPAEWSQDGLPIVRIQNLNNASAPFNRFKGGYDPKHYLKGGELLFAWSGTPGTSFGAHVWRGGEALLNQHIFRVDFDDALLDPRFFRHAINQKLTELIGVAHGGAGLQHVTKGVFEGTEVSLPPRAEQKRIADKLDTVLTRVDAVNTRLARVAPLLKRFRQSVLAAATSGKLTCDINAGVWPICTDLGTHCEVLGGKRLPKGFQIEEEDTGFPYIRVTDFDNFGVKVDQVKYVPKDAAQAISRYIIKAADVYISIAGSIGLVGRVPARFDGANLTENAARIVISSEIHPSFLMYQLGSPQLQDQMHEKKIATTQDKLGLFRVKTLQVCIPSFDEQTEIVRRVETLFAFADRLEARLQTAQTAANRLTPALLAKAFRGELVPQDPNDEPASELLKRLAGSTPASVTKRGRKKTSDASA